MSKRIPKRVREEAALLCAIAASTDWPLGSPAYQCRVLFAASMRANDAAGAAWNHALIHSRQLNSSECWAEAESLLRTGWSPGDEP